MFTVPEAHTALRDVLNERVAGFFYEDSLDNPLYNYLDWAQKQIYSELLKGQREIRKADPSFTFKAIKPMLQINNRDCENEFYFPRPDDFLEIDSLKFLSLVGATGEEVQEYYPAREVDINEFNKKQASKYTSASFRTPIFWILGMIKYAPVTTGNLMRSYELTYYRQITTIVKTSTVFQLGETIRDSLIEIAYGRAMVMDKKETLGLGVINNEIKKLKGAIQ